MKSGRNKKCHVNSSEMTDYQLVDNDSDSHARSPSGLLTGSPLIRAASSSAKDDGPVF